MGKIFPILLCGSHSNESSSSFQGLTIKALFIGAYSGFEDSLESADAAPAGGANKSNLLRKSHIIHHFYELFKLISNM